MNNPFISQTRLSQDLVPISPELANELLENFNSINARKLDKNEAKRLCRAILAGEWEENTGARILFEQGTGNVLDGQTRLEAIRMAKQIVKCDVLFGLHRKISLYSDVSRKRSYGVTIASSIGKTREDVNDLSHKAAAARVWLRSKNNWKINRFTREEIKNFVVKNFDALETMGKKKTFVPAQRAGVVGALAFYFTKHPNEALEFLSALTADDVSYINIKSPAIVLRNYLSQINSNQQHSEKQLKTDFQATLFCCFCHFNKSELEAIAFKETWE